MVLPTALSGTWSTAAAPRIFSSADLYGAINGGAELFLELGFERLTQQKLKGPGGDVQVDLYRMKDADAALGIYLVKSGKPTPDPALALRHTVNRHQLMYVRGRHFGLLTRASAGSSADLVALARAQASLIPDAASSDGFALLPKAGRIAGSERILRGPVSLQTLYSLGEGDVLQLAGRRTALAAEFEDKARGKHILIVAPYASGAEARAALVNLRKDLDPYLDVRVDTAARLVFEDFEHLFGEARLEGPRLLVRLRLRSKP
jgi:hypothetical protein